MPPAPVDEFHTISGSVLHVPCLSHFSLASDQERRLVGRGARVGRPRLAALVGHVLAVGHVAAEEGLVVEDAIDLDDAMGVLEGEEGAPGAASRRARPEEDLGQEAIIDRDWWEFEVPM